MSRLNPQIERLRWQCRRGMLELDFLLMRYLDDRFADADVLEQARFAELLKEQDPTLNEWLISGIEAPEEFRELVGKIRGI